MSTQKKVVNNTAKQFESELKNLVKFHKVEQANEQKSIFHHLRMIEKRQSETLKANKDVLTFNLEYMKQGKNVFELVGFLTPLSVLNYNITDSLNHNLTLETLEKYTLLTHFQRLNEIESCVKKANVVSELRKVYFDGLKAFNENLTELSNANRALSNAQKSLEIFNKKVSNLKTLTPKLEVEKTEIETTLKGAQSLVNTLQANNKKLVCSEKLLHDYILKSFKTFVNKSTKLPSTYVVKLFHASPLTLVTLKDTFDAETYGNAFKRIFESVENRSVKLSTAQKMLLCETLTDTQIAGLQIETLPNVHELALRELTSKETTRKAVQSKRKETATA